MNTDFSLDETALAFNTRSRNCAGGVRSPIPSPATKVSAATAKQQHQDNNNQDQFHRSFL